MTKQELIEYMKEIPNDSEIQIHIQPNSIKQLIDVSYSYKNNITYLTCGRSNINRE